jgi:hypothetical protein
LILQFAAEIWKMNLNFKTNFDSVDRGADEAGRRGSMVLADTDLGFTSNLSPTIQIEWAEDIRQGRLTGPDGRRRRGFGGSRGWQRCRRCSEDLGELKCMVKVLNRVQ